MTHSYTCPLRWADMDAQGHVNNAAYLDYMQEARVHYLLSGPEIMHSMLATGVLVVSHSVEYLEPVRVDERPLRVDLWVDTVGASRFSVGYELSHADRMVARARTGAVAYDLRGGSVRRLHPEERSVLESARAHREPMRSLPRANGDHAGHRYPLTVRWSDLDSYGHVNNVKYYDYVQEARIALMAQALEWPAEDVWVIVRQDIAYLKPIDFRLEPYEVRTTVVEVGRRSFTLEAEIADPLNGNVFARAQTVVVGQSPLTPTARGRLRSWGSEVDLAR